MVDVNAALQVEDAGVERNLRVTDLTVLPTGAAADSSLQAVLTELSQKLEPADITALATAVKQDAAKTVLDAILVALAVSQPRDVIDRAARLLGHVSVDNFPASQTVTGPLTDAQLRASAVLISGALTDTQLRATAVPVSQVSQPLPAGAATEGTVGKRFAGAKLAKTAQVTALGETVVVDPAPGKRIVLYWVSAINDPDADVSPRIRIGWQGDADYLYSAYAVAHWEEFIGAVDQNLVVNLDQAADVAFTAHFLEV